LPNSLGTQIGPRLNSPRPRAGEGAPDGAGEGGRSPRPLGEGGRRPGEGPIFPSGIHPSPFKIEFVTVIPAAFQRATHRDASSSLITHDEKGRRSAPHDPISHTAASSSLRSMTRGWTKPPPPVVHPTSRRVVVLDGGVIVGGDRTRRHVTAGRTPQPHADMIPPPVLVVPPDGWTPPTGVVFVPAGGMTVPAVVPWKTGSHRRRTPGRSFPAATPPGKTPALFRESGPGIVIRARGDDPARFRFPDGWTPPAAKTRRSHPPERSGSRAWKENPGA
jgi:hypothetical protein